MIISYQLLQSFFSTPLGLNPKELGDRLTQHGIEVERYLPMPAKEHLSLGKVTQVSEGQSTLCLADSSIEIACSYALEKDLRYVLDCFDGAWQLTTPSRLDWSSLNTPLWVPNGLSLDQAWELDDQLIELSITPNRGDCLSYVGLCRDIALSQKNIFSKATLIQQFKDRYKVVWDGQTQMDVQLDPQLSPRYCVAKVYCPTRLQTPFWLQRFLIKHGLSSIMPSVDISQYLMIVFGHPSHAFDRHCLQDRIELGWKNYTQPQTLTLLDNKELSLTGLCPVITGGAGNVIALPGMMGSKDSAAQEDSRELILESAFFDPSAIRTMRKFGVVTEASLRFERGVDRQGQEDLLEIFCGMLQSMHPQVLCWSPMSMINHDVEAVVLKTTLTKLQSLAGVDISIQEVRSILDAMGADVEGEDFSLSVPSWRFDLILEQNFLAEILRVYGIDRITLPSMNRGSMKQVLCVDPSITPWIEKGFNEVATYSFVPKSWACIDHKEDDLIALENPLNQDFAWMRPSVWPSLLNVLAQNKRCGGQAMGVVEKAPIYHKSFPLFQKRVMSAAIYVQRHALHWDLSQPTSKEWTYYDIKGLIAHIGLTRSVRWEPLVEENAFLHPTISARLMDHDLCVGQVGLIHPVLAEQQGWPQAFLIQIDETCWDPAAPAVYKPFSRFQKVQRDFSLYCPASVKAENILSVFRKNVQYLESLRVFDYYAAENSLPTLGMSAIFQAFDKTLEDKDLVPMIQKALDALKEDLGVTLKNE